MPLPDQQLTLTDATMAKLNDLRARAKYVNFAPSMPAERLLAETQINSLIDLLRSQVHATPSKRFVLSEFSKTMAQFPGFDTEDREQFLDYLQEIMTVVGIESSDGLLNGWMYGPVLGPMADKISATQRANSNTDPKKDK